jgi:hypothetical protein
MVEKHFNISIAPVRSRGESLVLNKTHIPLSFYPRKSSRGISDIETPTFYRNDIAMRNPADMTDDKPIAVQSQSISVVSTDNRLVTF